MEAGHAPPPKDPFALLLVITLVFFGKDGVIHDSLA